MASVHLDHRWNAVISLSDINSYFGDLPKQYRGDYN
ncbi:hypothetical protein F441_04560 [Phytophthora nicotianae CJ01A1]|uniref:Uncharacterized protein n=6 Tax=Phytophthora nicotianae TaxID=4792 RepID=W2QKT2_PHYN3|nr:hypothetical protein PPTG_22426 [Phytophthora nicotianae INRA-310]ETI52218.1 hypothetical protein F443_04585 [Phytophthora nicotianae P1569]ETK92097.1 hypothetical protein L915_04458 [Phytophthora nicotianae]ETO80981.1 hypothetical protein F444_04615 [Phytophthora nicotianae P1976]ETP22035.1 hypothetical protein F441_04560 [Phytophthora nicotianae CJ01A1]ETP49923.1 hypothetical protein F442_04634 [Phytophthora nicotianae P10297]